VWNEKLWKYAARLSLIVIAVVLVFLASVFFDRFDPSRCKPRRTKIGATDSAPTPAITAQAVVTPDLTPLNKAANRFSFLNVLSAELKLLLKGQRWWWYAIAGGLIIACVVSPSAAVHRMGLAHPNLVSHR